MNILVVNDDGIQSPGLACLARVAARLGRVWVVAPAQQCSAMSHRITVFGSLELRAAPDFPGQRSGSLDCVGNPGRLRQSGAGPCAAPKAGPCAFRGQPGL